MLSHLTLHDMLSFQLSSSLIPPFLPSYSSGQASICDMYKCSVIWFVSHLKFQFLNDQVIWWDLCCATRFATGWVFLPLAQFYCTHRGLWFCSPTRWVFCSSSSSSSSSSSPSRLLHTPRSDCTWHILMVPGWKCRLYLKVFKKHEWGKRSLPESMKDSKWSILLSCKKLNIFHTFISLDAKLMTVMFHFFAFLW